MRLDFSNVRWRKASASQGPNGQCVEVGAVWRKASASQGPNGACVEVSGCGEHFAVRDSKDPGGPVLAFDADDWTAFIGAVRG